MQQVREVALNRRYDNVLLGQSYLKLHIAQKSEHSPIMEKRLTGENEELGET